MKNWLPKILMASGIITTVIGLLVLLGYHFNSQLLIQVLPYSAAMAYSTAICLLLSGISLLAIIYQRLLLARLIGLSVLAITLAKLRSFIFVNTFDIDDWFNKHFPDSIIGIMTPVTVCCFLLAGVSIIMMSTQCFCKYRSMIIGLLGATINSTGSVAVFGYLLGLATIYHQAYAARVALHSAIGFSLLGIGILCFAIKEDLETNKAVSLRWLPIAVGIGMMTATLYISQALSVQITQVGVVDTHLPLGSLLLGIIVTTLLASTIYFAQRLQFQLIQTSIINERLAAEIEERKLIEKELKIYTNQVQDLYNKAPCGYHSIDQNGVIVRMNDTELAWLGYQRAELLGRNCQEVLTPESQKIFHENFPIFKERGKIFGLEFELIRKDGTIFPIMVNSSSVTDSEGKFLYSRSTAIDITELKRADEALKQANRELEQRVAERTAKLSEANQALTLEIAERRESEISLRKAEARYNCLFNSNFIGIIISDFAGQIIDANNAFLKMINYSQQELLDGKIKWLELTPPEFLYLDTKAAAELKRHGYSAPYEKVYIHKDGHWVPILLTLTSLEGSLDTVVGFVLDLTEQKSVQEKMREQAEYLDKTQDAIMALDLDGRIIYWNKGAERTYGWLAREVQSQPAKRLQFMREDSRFIEADRAVMTRGEWSGEVIHISKDGTEMTMESRWTLVHDESGKPKSKLIVNTDISEKKRIIAQFLRTQRVENIGMLASGIAHDLNNALSPILMATRVLMTRITDGDSHKLLEMISRSANRSADMVKQVLAFARGIEGEHLIIQLKHMLYELKGMISQTLPKSIEIEMSVSPNLWMINGDSTQLTQVLMNLLINARDAMPSGGKLKIKAENVVLNDEDLPAYRELKPGHFIALTIADTGSGIPKEIREKIFLPFFTTKEIGRGTGLGLSTALGIVKSHGGFIDLHSEIGKGTTFKIFLPSVEAEVEKGITADLPMPWLGKGEVILVVDDEELLREIISSTLKDSGYEVIPAANGIEALSVYVKHQEQIKVVLLDMIMPYLDGAGAIRALKRLDPDVKIIAMSGTPDSYQNSELAKQITAVLPKPFNPEDLLDIIARTLMNIKFQEEPGAVMLKQ